MATVQQPVVQTVMAAAPCVVLPASARERKQVYMHSAIFEAGPHTSVYNASHQTQAMHEVNRCRAVQFKPQEVVVMSPADYKATVNAGHGVVMPTTSPVGAPELVRVHGPGSAATEPAQVVHAQRESGAIPREFRATGSNLAWTDVRNETVHCRGQEFWTAHGGLNAQERKAREYSSEVFGSTRRLERSTACPSQEIRPVGMEGFYVVDSTLDHCRPSPRERAQATQAALAAPQSPRTARMRQNQQLGTSAQSPFSAYAKPLPEDGPGKEAAAELEARRRTERNYSDLFGSAPTAKRSQQRTARADVEAAATCSFLNPTVEIAARRRHTIAGQHAKEEEVMIYGPRSSSNAVLPTTPRMQRPELSAEEQRTLTIERACWDTPCAMQLGAEVARRHRERRLTGPADPAKPLSARERKRVDMCSKGLRMGMGAQPEPHDDGRAGPGPAGALSSVQRARSVVENPKIRSIRNTRPDSARERRIHQLMSNIF